MDVRAFDARFAELLALDEPVVDARDLPPNEACPLQGRLLELLARMCAARSILELGTLAGYSTLWLARALPADGELVTIESDPRHVAVAPRNLAADPRIHLIEGDAREALAGLTGTFELV